jgi:hypothetical protein
MMPVAARFKPGFIHIRAFRAGSAIARLTPFSSHP